MPRRLRLLVALGATAVIVLPLAWFWQQSLLPASYSMMDMGYLDPGRGPALSTHDHGHPDHRAVSVNDLDDPLPGAADVRATITAAQQKITVAGHQIDGFTLNGSTPGPTIRATEGDIVEVVFRNKNVADGSTLHWHGLDVPNTQDGVAGVTQNAVMPGTSHTYRFRADQVGTYWFHSHQVSHKQVVGGLFGALVIDPKAGIEQDRDVLAVAHTYRGNRTLNGSTDDQRVAAQPGEKVRVRIVNTDDGTLSTWASTPFRVVAIDGYDIDGPNAVRGQQLRIAAGGRADLEVTVPRSQAARIQLGATALLVGNGPPPNRPQQPTRSVNLLTYGTPSEAAAKPDRTFEYIIGRRPGFLDGKPGLWWTINGHLYPDIPMFVVREGETARFRIRNESSEVHPMHLHGHHVRLLAVDGKPARGSEIWMDSIDVEPDQTVDLQFRADNPGIWMDHCHNLPHAAEGLVAHLMYEGITTPYRVGPRNAPE